MSSEYHLFEPNDFFFNSFNKLILYNKNNYFYSRRLSLCIALTTASFLTVAKAKTELVAALGVALTSMASGLGETTLLSYMVNYERYEHNIK